MAVQPGQWQWALETPTGGGLLRFLTAASERDLTYARRAPAVAKCSVDLYHDDAAAIVTAALAGGGGVPVLRARRRERQADLSLLQVTRFAGKLSALEEDSDSGLLKVAFTQPPGDLAWRLTRDIDDFPNIDAGSIYQQLVAAADADSPLGWTVGTVETTVNRDVTYNSRTLSDVESDLTDSFDGFDYDFAPANGASLGVLNVYRRMGVQRDGAKFGQGAGTLRNATGARRIWTPPRNLVRMLGDDGSYQDRSDAMSIATYGKFAATDQLADTIDAGTLAAAAQDRLRPGWQRAIAFSPEPYAVDDNGDAITPRPWLDYWLGDQVWIEINEGALQVEADLVPVDGIRVSIDDNGFEDAHELTIPDPT